MRVATCTCRYWRRSIMSSWSPSLTSMFVPILVKVTSLALGQLYDSCFTHEATLRDALNEIIRSSEEQTVSILYVYKSPSTGTESTLSMAIRQYTGLLGALTSNPWHRGCHSHSNAQCPRERTPIVFHSVASRDGMVQNRLYDETYVLDPRFQWSFLKLWAYLTSKIQTNSFRNI